MRPGWARKPVLLPVPSDRAGLAVPRLGVGGGDVSRPRALQVSFPGSVSWLPRKASGLSSPDAVVSVLCRGVSLQMSFCCWYQKASVPRAACRLSCSVEKTAEDTRLN